MRFSLLFLLLFYSCSAQKFTQKAYIAITVQHEFNGTYYMFANLTLTEGREFLMQDTAQCKQGDTIIIKDYRLGLFKPKKTVFVKMK